MSTSKRARSQDIPTSSKKFRTDCEVVRTKVATAEAAAKVDAEPPLDKLLNALKADHLTVSKGDAVVYWMRMEDMRSPLRHPLFLASS